MLDALTRMFDHMEWANTLVIDALRAQDEPNADALRLFAHILGAEEIWLSRILERPPRVAVWPSLSVEECAILAAENRDAYASVLADLDDRKCDRPVRYRNSAGLEFVNTLGDVLVHVSQHGSYHRGQIATRLRAAGTTPPYTDFIGFARRDQPGGTLDAGRASNQELGARG